jgi:hypothetical protein
MSIALLTTAMAFMNMTLTTPLLSVFLTIPTIPPVATFCQRPATHRQRGPSAMVAHHYTKTAGPVHERADHRVSYSEALTRTDSATP